MKRKGSGEGSRELQGLHEKNFKLVMCRYVAPVGGRMASTAGKCTAYAGRVGKGHQLDCNWIGWISGVQTPG